MPSIKFHRLLYFGSRASQAEVMFPDEQLQHKVYKAYEKEENEHNHSKIKLVMDALGYSGILIITISLFVVPL
ncbi:hypothetical protein NC661_19535 [Aquibacillus koreensis]|uniref:Uncharacterized protein n=1 Tax=Aquibacillus koreensis TaxID=279446 RepID=A0A9X3WSD6_9BACI|nr:hypothetical protein [Aquibacillus koreensis]MCT2535384.1 hypothetical protein [Aquibacillus koreensis]MDC3422549.1 hypothetical protein [Aquibacillus koreensis]